MADARARRMIEQAHGTVRRLTDGGDAAKEAERLIPELSKMAARRDKERLRPITDVLEDCLTAYDEAVSRKGEWAGFACGLRAINNQLNGLCRGETTVIGARPGVGKTVLAAQIAASVARDVHVVYVSLEMSERQLLTRMICAEAGVPISLYRRGQLQADQVDDVRTAVGRLAALQLDIVYAPGASVPRIRALVDSRRSEVDVGLVVVDYIQLMTGHGSDENTILQGISSGLCQSSRDLDVHLLVTSQLNRGPETRGGDYRPRSSDFRGSGGIEQDADNTGALYRPGAYEELLDKARRDGKEAAIECQADITWSKCRHEGGGRMRLAWDSLRHEFIDAQSWSETRL